MFILHDVYWEGTQEFHFQEITGITLYWYAELNVIGCISVLKPFLQLNNSR